MRDRARLAEGQPSLRVGQVAAIIGYSDRYVRKLFDSGVLKGVRLAEGTERRVPVDEVRRLARQLGMWRLPGVPTAEAALVASVPAGGAALVDLQVAAA